jgi:hypothetical protein
MANTERIPAWFPPPDAIALRMSRAGAGNTAVEQASSCARTGAPSAKPPPLRFGMKALMLSRWVVDMRLGGRSDTPWFVAIGFLSGTAMAGPYG